MLVSGILISYSEYLGLVSDQMKSIPDPDISRSMSEAFARLADGAQEAERERAQEEKLLRSLEEEPEDEFMPAYIHLRDTKFFLTDVDMTGVDKPIIDGTVWRGKIAAVDGFFLGAFHRGHASS
jgi:hypothetical protein